MHVILKSFIFCSILLTSDFSFLFAGILQNESINGHFKNVSYMCADVTSPDMQILPESVDLIFSNWLLMYLSDNEVIDIFLYFPSDRDKKND